MTIEISVIGPGAIGGIAAAWLAQVPEHKVTVCARTPFDRIEVDMPQGPLHAAPQVLTHPSQARPADWALVCTKAYDVAGAAAWLERVAGPETMVAVLQNGIEHVERFAPYVPRDRILPVVVDIPGERSAPGRILQRAFGTMTLPARAPGEAFRALFAHTPIAVSTTPDFTTALWRKLAFNCAGAVNALVLKPAGIVAAPGLDALMEGLVQECLAVGRAEGAALGPEIQERAMAGLRGAPPESVNSLQADRMAGRPMEIDARNGVIVRLGARHGIPTPLNALMVTLLEAAQ
jgi:2-dehydropantoate 2-reductase